MLLNTIQLIMELGLTSQCVFSGVSVSVRHTFTGSNSDGVPDNASDALSNRFAPKCGGSMQRIIF